MEDLPQTEQNDNPPAGYVRRQGKLFELGLYPGAVNDGSDFSLDATEAEEAVAHFTPVAGDLEHKGTVLDGKLGVLRDIWLKGNEIWGAADVPEWLHNQLDNTRSRISLAWSAGADKATGSPIPKRIIGFGWVKDPAIPDAALFSAYATFAAQQESELTAALTGVPSGSTALAGSAASVNSLGGHGVGKATLRVPDGSGKAQPKKNTNRSKNMSLQTKVGAKLAALFSGSKTTESEQSGAAQFTLGQQQLISQLPAVVAALQQGQAQAQEGTEEAEVEAESAMFSAPGSTVDQMDEATADFRAQQIVSRAAELADSIIDKGYAYDYKRNALIALFTAAGLDNDTNGPTIATFAKSDGTVINDRVSLALEVLEGGPKHSLFSKDLPVYTLNGDRSKSEKQSSVEEADKQAAEFNAQFAASIPALAAQIQATANANK